MKRQVLSFMPQELYIHVKTAQYPLDRGLSEPQTLLEKAENRKISAPAGNMTLIPQSSST
jgi:hypothetical protein